MSDDKRRSARTQSRFSSDKDIPPSRREKEKQKGQKKSSKGGEKTKNDSPVPKMAAEGVSVEYQENSNYTFKELEKKKKPEELRFQGLHELSKTENGVSRLIYDAEFMLKEQAKELMTMLHDTTTWYDKNIVIRGEEFPQPRLVAWYGPFPYTYSGATLEAAEMPPTVLDIKQRVELFLRENGIDVDLNSVLLNLYRTEKDSVAWHSDDELTMGVCPTIASVSLGSTRRFEMKPKFHTIKQMETLDEESIFYVNLGHGSLIIMDGCMQKDWQHRVPKEYHNREPRINLTFRTVYPIDKLPPQLPYSKVESIDKTSSSKKSPAASFDIESFPPLMPAKQKNKTFTNSKASCDGVASNQQISPNGLQDTAMEYVDENENQNNLNKDLDCCTLEDSSHYNLMEPEKSFDKLPASNEFEDDVSEKTYTDDSSSSKKICLEDDSQECESAIDNGIKEESKSQMSNRYRFNINAPDFVPKNLNVASSAEIASEPIYAKYSIHNLVQYYETDAEMSAEELEKFSKTLFNKIDWSRHDNLFTVRDIHELRTLRKLNDGGQNHSNRRIIVERVCSIVQKCEYEEKHWRDYRSPNRYHGNRTGYSGDSYRSRNFSRGGSYRH